MSIAATSDLLRRGVKQQQNDGIEQKATHAMCQPRRLPTMRSTIQLGDFLMSDILPTIIVLAITALVVFHRELTT